MTSYRYRVVDVFTERTMEGNPLAVFPGAKDVKPETMQRIARELNLSETVFFVPSTRPECALGLRIFTPARELPFAGHPTVGAAFVALQDGFLPKDTSSFAFDEKVGAVPVRIDVDQRPLIWLTTPVIRWENTFDPALCAAALRLNQNQLLAIPPQLLNAGNPTLFVALKDRSSVDTASLDSTAFQAIQLRESKDPFCIFPFCPEPGGAYSRMFAPSYGIIEDPATGSSTGPLGAYMIRHNLMPGKSDGRFVSEQGTKMGRRSILHIYLRGENGSEGIDVGGHVTPIIEATLTI